MAKPFYKNLTYQVLIGILLGVLAGCLFPDFAKTLKPLADAFVNMVKMIVGPIVFLTIVVGVSSMGDLKKVGRVGGKAILYFEVVTTIALAIGLLVVNVVKPGRGVSPQTVTASNPSGKTPSTSPATTKAAVNPEVEKYRKASEGHSFVKFLLDIIPDTVVGAFAKGDLLPILFFSVLFGIAGASLGLKGSVLMTGLEQLIEVLFRIVRYIMLFGPIAVFGAIAYTVGGFGLHTLIPLLKLLGCVLLTMGVFIIFVLGAICVFYRFSLWQYLRFIKEELILVLGVSSSEPALPRMMEKLELLGCDRGIVGLVIPAGYSFNLDGTSIYLSMAALFIAQAYNIHLGWAKQLEIMAILMLTSKGAAAVTGGGFITLAATITATGDLPIEGLALLLGVDRFMSTGRALTNLIGNGIATIVVSKMEGEFDQQRYEAAISGRATEPAPVSAEVAADLGRG